MLLFVYLTAIMAKKSPWRSSRPCLRIGIEITAYKKVEKILYNNYTCLFLYLSKIIILYSP